MADYWKSNAKKFCEFCKCWIADNKPSVEFHEKGKRHKENVALRLKNISRQSVKDHKDKQKYDDDIKKMEKAALEAYLKDVERNADYTSQMLNEELGKRSKETNSVSDNDKEEKSKEKREKEKKNKEDKMREKLKIWYEAVSDEGYTYYWNTTTGESVWEPPEGSYTSIAEQKKLEEEEMQREAKKKIGEDRLKEERKKMKAEECRAFLEREGMKKRSKVKEIETKSAIVMGPAPQGNPYGSWTISKRSEAKPVDLQLPEQNNVDLKFIPTLIPMESEVKFKEKNIDSLQSEGGSNVNFRKRKFNSSTRNTRQRLHDD